MDRVVESLGVPFCGSWILQGSLWSVILNTFNLGTLSLIYIKECIRISSLFTTGKKLSCRLRLTLLSIYMMKGLLGSSAFRDTLLKD